MLHLFYYSCLRQPAEAVRARRFEVVDAAGKVRAGLNVAEDGQPRLGLHDAAQQPRAVLGATSLETVKAAKAIMRPESSLVLFDKDGNVMWKTP